MTKAITTLILFIALITSCESPQDKAKPVDETGAVRAAFDNYKSAILNDQGEDAVKYVDSRTMKYYSDMLELVKNANEAEVNALSVVDKMMVLTVRHRTSKEDILSFDGKELLVYAIKSGMVGKNSVSDNTIGEITIDNNFAKGQLISKGQKAPFYFHFYKEDDQWKIDITSIFSVATATFENIIQESGQEENEFIFSLLEMVSGKKPGPEVWEPVK
jgi:hypothetical protein